ncbi:hypothetical protein RHSIM_Rhsim06G0055900 [Rhododendron simsii]|uniref:Tyrosine-protein kinase catalytic domain-containing protein n=1 Tax=Rhododendron simsii TaxID=118357 RepID=A0A834LID2_RHOSS|nr:hypothetical protein RHSIM_Rhsim06G0055900 [Rhododendron simsii]
MNVWESFDSPTDTLLPNQPMTRNSRLVSSRSHNNFSSGFYSLFFDDDNLLRLAFDDPEISSVYWPDPDWDNGRSSYDSSRIAALNSSGYFRPSDGFEFQALDYGTGAWRRLKMGVDGNVRLYSLNEEKRIWSVSWQAMSEPCKIHGVCGPNAMCNYDFSGENAGRRCSCLPGYKAKNLTDWSLGCEPEFNLSCNATEFGCIKLPNVEFYGYDIKFYENYTYERVAAIKRLNETNHGEAEFLAEVSTIRRVNHMNLIELWGYCLEGNHRLLVYKYMAHGSLAENLISGTLNWEKSYGVVVMEMVTGKSPMTMGGQGSGNTWEMEQGRLVKWVREKKNGTRENELWLEEIIDPVMKGKCDLRKMEILVQVALECLEEDKDARPTMKQVIERLLPH